MDLTHKDIAVLAARAYTAFLDLLDAQAAAAPCQERNLMALWERVFFEQVVTTAPTLRSAGRALGVSRWTVARLVKRYGLKD